MKIRYILLGSATALTLGLNTLAASAAILPGPTVNGVEEIGYQAGDPTAAAPWHYRFVQAQVTLPDVTGNVDKAAFPGGYGVSVRLTNDTSSAVLGLSTTPGSGAYNPAFDLEYRVAGTPVATGCVQTNSKAIPAGDTVEFAIYFDGTHLNAGVTDESNAALDFSFSCTDPVAGDLFTQAEIGTEFGVTPWSAASLGTFNGQHDLAQFSNTVVTNRTGIRGSAGSARWPVQRLSLGSSYVSGAWGSYAASPDNVVRGGRNFTSVIVG